jgi:anti-sigma factor RsiW
MTTQPTACERYQDDLTELALGTLTGRDRAQALSHVESCQRCSEDVEELSRAADDLLQVVAPEAEPPVGFEVRWLERLHDTQRQARDKRPTTSAARGARQRKGWLAITRARVITAAAAVCVLIAGVGVGWAETHSSSPAVRPPLQATLLSAGGQPIGRVVASAGSPAWLFMVVQSGTLTGKLTCKVGLKGGRWEVLGQFSLDEGYGTWSAPLAVSVNVVQRAELVTSKGAVVASATFPA